MDVGKSLTYIFEDPRWFTKLLVGTLVLVVSTLLAPILIGVLGFAIVGGYGLEVLRNVRREAPVPLPEWKDRWGEWLILGLKLFVVLLVWILPLLLLIIPLLLAGLMSGNEDLAFLTVALLTCAGCLATLWGVVVLLVSPAIYIRVAETESIGGGLDFSEILLFTRDHIGDVLIALLVYWLASLVVGFLGSVLGFLLCFVGLFVTAPLAQLITMLIQSHLFAQVGRSNIRAAGSPAIIGPDTPVTTPVLLPDTETDGEVDSP
jgi:hypothetical protein